MRLRNLAAATVLAGALVPAGVSQAMADMCDPTPLPVATRAAGYTFIGRLTEIEYVGDEDVFTYLWFDVEEVFAGAAKPPDGPFETVLNEGSSVRLYASDCNGIRKVHEGDRYLISTKRLWDAPSFWTAVWRVSGDNADFIRMYPGDYDARLAQADSVNEAVALVMGGLPPTDAVPQAARQPDIALLFAGLASLLVAARLTRRRTVRA